MRGNRATLECFSAVAIAFAGILVSGAAIADKPSPPRSQAAAKPERARYFSDRHWMVVRDFYNEQMRVGKCPLGFVRKDDGCEPPDQIRKWQLGKPLPPGAVRFDLPQVLAAKLGKPPLGHRYLRVGADILLVSNKTKLIVDGVLDLGRK